MENIDRRTDIQPDVQTVQSAYYYYVPFYVIVLTWNEWNAFYVRFTYANTIALATIHIQITVEEMY